MREVMQSPNKNNERDPVYLFYGLKNFPNQQKYIKAEYLYFENKYRINKYPEELPICVISVGRNLK